MFQYRAETIVTASGSLQSIYRSWNPHGIAQTGPLDGTQLNSAYETKGQLQQKRYAAQKIGTTYVYDYPEMFKQAVNKMWKEQAVTSRSSRSLTIGGTS